MSDNKLKILTYNIHKGFSPGNLRFVLHKIKSALQATNADVIFLQEILGDHSIKSAQHQNWPDNSQFEFLADEIWSHHAYGKNAIYDTGHHGNAILSKFPFINCENINVSFMKSASRSLLHGVIQMPQTESPLHVICVHLGLFAYERQRQLIKLVKRIEETVPHDEPLIIAGDFNDWRGIAEKHLSSDLGLVEVFKSQDGSHARTFPAWMPLLTMDRIYCRGVQICDQQRLNEKPWRGLSDHLPLIAELQIP